MQAGVADLFPRTASTDLGAAWFKDRDRWSEYPSVGAQVFYGHNGDMNHTGIVLSFDDTWITTVEGNTNTSGSPQGDGVYLMKRARRSENVQGYGHPAYVEDKPAQPAAPVARDDTVRRIRDAIKDAIKAKANNRKRKRKLRAARKLLPKK